MLWFRRIVFQFLVSLPLVFAQCYFPNGVVATDNTPWYVRSALSSLVVVVPQNMAFYCYPKIYPKCITVQVVHTLKLFSVSNAEGYTHCCDLDSHTCETNRLCLSRLPLPVDPHQDLRQKYARGTCTDQSWSSGECPQVCIVG